MPMTGAQVARFHARYAWLGGAEPDRDVLIEVDRGRFSAVRAGVGEVPPDATRLPGLVLPGLANAHSHAFHRALRGRTGGSGTFWSWREQMYALAGRLDPDSYHALARATYAELATAGITCVGEFHYLHHQLDGSPYTDPNAMGEALIAAAEDAGIRITLLDTLYLTSTVDGAPLAGVARRFGDADVHAWRERAEALTDRNTARIGHAAHSVRAVPADALPVLTAVRPAGRPLHVHLSEQPAENAECQAVHGCSPTELLHRHGLLGPDTTAVHATHLSAGDIALLGASGTRVCLCPSTERDLADGLGPAHPLADAGSPLCVGSDSHAVVDPFEEMRGVELHERLRTGRRGHFTAGRLLDIGAAAGHAALGWPDAGRIAVGARADLVAVGLDSVRTAGVAPAGALAAATAADVSHVLVDGRLTVADGRHVGIDVPAALRAAIGALT